MSPLLLVLALIGPTFAKPKAAPPPPPPPPAPMVDPEAWRATPPQAGPASPWTPPTARTFTLANGIPVYLVENPGLPLVSLRLYVGAGREVNPEGKAGLAALTANLLDEGTTTRSATRIAEEAAGLGAVISTESMEGSASLALDALTGDALAPSLDLFADVVLHPAFAKPEFQRVQAETLAAIEEARAEPRDVAYRQFLAQMFGTSHPYGTPAIGTVASVKAIKAGDVKKLYQSWYHAKNAVFVVTGDITEARAKELLDARFGTWVAGATVQPAQAAAATPLKTRVVFQEQPGAVQSVIRVGTPGVVRTSSEYYAAQMAGTIIAGMFSSRINMNLREDKGWSYGAGGGFSDSRDAGLLQVRTSVQADKTAPAVAEILKELANAAKTPPTGAEVKMANDYLLKSLPGNFETNAYTAASLLDIPRYGLGPDAFAVYQRELSEVTSQATAAAASRFFDPSRMVVVVVGPRKVEDVDVVKSLKDLGYELVEVP